MGKDKKKKPKGRLPEPVSQAKVVLLVGACKGEQIDENLVDYPNATIYAIEPFPRNIQLIKDRWGTHPRVAVIEKAAWSSNGTKEFIDYGESHKHSFFFRPTSEPKRKGKLVVETLDFAEFLDSFDKVDYLRFNIEGSEYEVLLHCFKAGVMRKVDELKVEFHSDRIPGLEERDLELRRLISNWGVLNVQRRWKRRKS